jgi:hypothetical protein
MKTLIISVVILFILSSSFAFGEKHFLQRDDHDYRQDTLRIESGFWGLNYFRGSQELSRHDFDSVLNQNDFASNIFTTEKEYVDFYSFTFYLSLGMVAAPLIPGIAKNDEYGNYQPNYSLLLVGMIALKVSYVFYTMSVTQAEDALRVYNEGIYKDLRKKDNMTLGFEFTGNGFGLSLRF